MRLIQTKNRLKMAHNYMFAQSEFDLLKKSWKISLNTWVTTDHFVKIDLVFHWQTNERQMSTKEKEFVH